MSSSLLYSRADSAEIMKSVLKKDLDLKLFLAVRRKAILVDMTRN